MSLKSYWHNTNRRRAEALREQRKEVTHWTITSGKELAGLYIVACGMKEQWDTLSSYEVKLSARQYIERVKGEGKLPTPTCDECYKRLADFVMDHYGIMMMRMTMTSFKISLA